jgi:hypothetical protein
MAYNAHDLQFTVLDLSLISMHDQKGHCGTNLEPLILQHSLDGSILTTGRHLCLEHNAEGAISNDFALGILHFLGLAGQAILNLFTYDFCISKDGQPSQLFSGYHEQQELIKLTPHTQAREYSGPVLRHHGGI